MQIYWSRHIFLSILRDKTFDREKENSGDYSVPYIWKVFGYL